MFTYINFILSYFVYICMHDNFIALARQGLVEQSIWHYYEKYFNKYQNFDINNFCQQNILEWDFMKKE